MWLFKDMPLFYMNLFQVLGSPTNATRTEHTSLDVRVADLVCVRKKETKKGGR
jgi:hypothetical protein